MSPDRERAEAWLDKARERSALFFSTIEELSEHSDRELLIVATSLLDLQLRELIAAYMRDLSESKEDRLFGGSGPLSAFSSRISVTFHLGFISKSMRDDLGLLRVMRNKFAHHLECRSLDEDFFKSRANSLRLITLPSLQGDEIWQKNANDFLQSTDQKLYFLGRQIAVGIGDEDQHIFSAVGIYDEVGDQPKGKVINSVKSLHTLMTLATLARHQGAL